MLEDAVSQSATTYIFAMIVMVLACIALITRRKTPYKFPPGSEGFPLLGSLPMICQNPERTLAEWGWLHYGPVFYITAGLQRIIVLNTFESVQEGFSKKGGDLSGR